MAASLTRVAGLASTLLVAGCSVFGYRGGTEEPHYTVVDTLGPVTIRHYGERLAADTVVTDASSVESARDTGFKRLAGYIFGDNKRDQKIAMTAPVAQSSQKIAMTAPVSQQASGKGWRIRFFLPGDLTMASAPVPTNDHVVLHDVPAADYAVLRFSGDRSESAVDQHIASLRQHLNGSVWQPIAAPVAWFYDPPWTLPFLRRNEVAVEVKRAASP